MPFSALGYFLLLPNLLLFSTAKATIDQQVLSLEKSNSGLLQYPSQLTQNVIPKFIHSHNDCKIKIVCHSRDTKLKEDVQIGAMSRF